MDDNGAIIAGNYRYLLWRTWDERPRLLWVMLNPSTANATYDDPTIQRCIEFSKRESYGGLEVVNLFAYRTPYPEALALAGYPIGKENDKYVAEAAARASAIVVAWGAWGDRAAVRQRASDVIALLAQHSEQQLLCLGTTRKGCPCHPARIAPSTFLKPYR